jgi:hypothetical protein
MVVYMCLSIQSLLGRLYVLSIENLEKSRSEAAFIEPRMEVLDGPMGGSALALMLPGSGVSHHITPTQVFHLLSVLTKKRKGPQAFL